MKNVRRVIGHPSERAYDSADFNFDRGLNMTIEHIDRPNRAQCTSQKQPIERAASGYICLVHYFLLHCAFAAKIGDRGSAGTTPHRASSTALSRTPLKSTLAVLGMMFGDSDALEIDCAREKSGCGGRTRILGRPRSSPNESQGASPSAPLERSVSGQNRHSHPEASIERTQPDRRCPRGTITRVLSSERDGADLGFDAEHDPSFEHPASSDHDPGTSAGRSTERGMSAHIGLAACALTQPVAAARLGDRGSAGNTAHSRPMPRPRPRPASVTFTRSRGHRHHVPRGATLLFLGDEQNAVYVP
ncbi:hypothetical protein AURDEDRAFT_131567 [Auricularia subglabra TFB-10046 SS5]|uniref:Uncharacterized protein n=1 Tax=Auricularia subglabra (strain TFB-10046 / SS5) TaxID=717982 RepID=J0LB38_AURST|nr:hypothetical protein AURDEDRAFT_131567 [Auricularia subglabra TFB-10046 SS5]